jgi:(1->4)-alpha-D-glucan 1-alpha-D-glucosylmutase
VADAPRAAATYRLQLTPSFGFAEAIDVLAYLRDLGVTHVYLSPVWEATPGSSHGYDVVDPTRVRSDFGGARGFDALCEAALANDLRLVLDVVPNHMAVHDTNRWWNGRDRATYFDVDAETGQHRRFFEIDDLAAMRQEDPAVFDQSHALVRELAARPAVDGLRIDHVDGLRDPTAYLERLETVAPDAWIVVEKIVLGDERLPREWPVAGTTGYEFASRVLGLFVDPHARDDLDQLYRSVTGDERTWDQARDAGKRVVVASRLRPDVERVARALGIDADAVGELAVQWPVYRTYLRGNEGVERLQLLTGPVMAKGVEDRAFYDFTRFVALNEVGGEPDAFGLSVPEWHAACARVAAETPATMNTTATHDTKRGEDVRARLAVISEMPEWWAEVATDWMKRFDSIDGPTAYLLLQTVVGAWPLTDERLIAYMTKAVREAGARTSWAAPDERYERAVADASRAALQEDVDALSAPLLLPGRVNALAQTLLRVTAPGTPDTYQGTEEWDLSLVDPDNRRPVDFALRRRALAAVRSASPEEWLRHGDGAWSKLAVLTNALQLRRERPDAFAGDYAPLATDSDALVAFVRGDSVVTVVPIMNATRRPVGDVALPAGRWVNRLTHETFARGRVDASELLARFPVALLSRE